MLDAGTILEMGGFCDQLIADPRFQFISAYFEQQCVAELLKTKPHEAKARECIYAQITAHREFISTMVEMIKKKNEAEQPEKPQDHLDIIDDPNVHDIYR